MTTIRSITLFLAVALFTGCPPVNENDAATGDAITLDDCETSFGDGVQAFYSTYFSCVTVSVSGPTPLSIQIIFRHTSPGTLAMSMGTILNGPVRETGTT